MSRKDLKLPFLGLDLALIVILVAAALAVRIPVVMERKLMPAGDVFNLQHIADHIVRGSYPPQENRLPGFPAIILLTRPFPVDPVQAAVGISLAMSSLMLACLYGTGRVLRIHRVPLFALLGLSVFDPLLMIGAVRPLSDATFLLFMSLYLFLITKELASPSPARPRSLVLIGLATVAMFLTRFEGVAVAALTLPLLWLKLPWKKVLLAVSIPLVAGLLWIPVHLSIHGSLAGGYVNAFADPSGDFGNIKLVPSKFMTMIKSAGWGAAWTLPTYETEQDPKAEAAARVVAQGSWWISLLAVLGIPWLLITKPRAALPLVLATVGYVGILVWWFLYSRFVVPLVPIFYITAAAGGSLLISLLGELSRPNSERPGARVGRQNFGRLEASLLLATVFFGWILWTESPRLHKQALGRAWESNGHGYAAFLSIRETAKLRQPTAYWTEAHAYATLYFKENGFYFNRHPDASPEELYTLMQDRQVKHLIHVGDDQRLPILRELLRQRGRIASTTTYRSFRWDDRTFEIAEVDNLTW